MAKFSARMRENSVSAIGCDAGENASHDPVAARLVEPLETSDPLRSS